MRFTLPFLNLGETMTKNRTPEPEPESQPEPADEESQPMNRAERRAKAKGKTVGQSNQPGRQGFSPKGGQAHTQRMWSNRRSGG
jgi:hypothetical protein